MDGLTTAIIVDQQRMGGDPRSTVGTATDANAMLRILFSRLGEAAHRLAPGVLVQCRLHLGRRGGHHRARRHHHEGATELQHHRRHVPTLRGPRHRQRLRPHRAVRRQQVAQRGCAHDPRLQHGRLVRPNLPRLRLLRPGQADPQVHQEGTARPAPQGADQNQGRRDQPDVRGADPADPEVVPVQGRRRDATAHPRVRGARGHLRHVPRLRRHPPHRGSPIVEDQGDQHRRRVCDADQRSGRMGEGTGRAVRRAVAGGAAAHPRLVRGDRARLPLASTGRRGRCRAARRSAPR